MFKFETFARLMVAIFFSVVSQHGFTQVPVDRPRTEAEIATEFVNANCYKDGGKIRIDTTQCKDNFSKAYPDGLSSCSKPEKEFMEQIGKFSEACDGFPKSAGVKTGGIGIACSDAMNRCKCAEAKPGDSTYTKLGCSEGDVGSNTRRSSKVDLDLNSLNRKYNYCPVLAAGDLKDLREEAKEARERIRELEEKKSAAQEKIAEAISEGQQKQDEIAQEAEEARKNAVEQAKQAREQHKNQKEQIEATRAQLNAQILDIEEKVVSHSNSANQADLEYAKAVAQLELSCHTQAENMAIEQRRIDQALAPTTAIGGQIAALKRVGTPTKQKYQRLAKRYYRDCIASGKYTVPKREFARVRNQGIDMAHDAIMAERKRIEQTRAEILRNETKLGEAAQELKQDIMEADMSARAQSALLNRKSQTAMAAGQSKAGMAAQEMGRMEREIAEEQSRLDELREWMSMRSSSGAGSENSNAKENYSKAQTELVNLRGKAQARADCCARENESFDASTSCFKAAAFLQSMGEQDMVLDFFTSRGRTLPTSLEKTAPAGR